MNARGFARLGPITTGCACLLTIMTASLPCGDAVAAPPTSTRSAATLHGAAADGSEGLGLVLAQAAPSATAADSLLDQRAEQIARALAGPPSDLASWFHPGFLAKVSEKQLRSIFADVAKSFGGAREVHSVSRDSPYSGRYWYLLEKGARLPVQLTIEPGASGRVIGLFLEPPRKLITAWTDIIGPLKALPGKTSFAAVRLPADDTSPGEVLAAHQPDLPLAIGSTFKLYVLATLVAQGRDWSDVVRLESRARSLPSGTLQNWPVGAPLTLYDLAARMISESDNTAADQLLWTLGREAVEAQVAATGHASPKLLAPFLTTREAFCLKARPELCERYRSGDVAARRALLAECAADDGPDYPEPTSVALDVAEWWASTADLARLAGWLARHADASAQEIMAINPGTRQPSEVFPYLGYKGGSEEGVVNFTWLARTADGAWYAVSASWNHEGPGGAPVLKLLGIVEGAFDLLRPAPAAAATPN